MTTVVQQGSGTLRESRRRSRFPEQLSVTVTAGPSPSAVTGFVVLTRGTDARGSRSGSRERSEARRRAEDTGSRPGTYKGTTAGGPSLVTTYRYPTGGDVQYPGPERVFRVNRLGAPGELRRRRPLRPRGAARHLRREREAARRLRGLPLDAQPVLQDLRRPRCPSPASIVPAAGLYDIVFDTRSRRSGRSLQFRYWVNDITPPKLRVTVKRRTIVVAATDAGSGVDPSTFTVTVDGRAVATHGKVVIAVQAKKGRHKVVVHASDYQEAKNMENVPPILPNTATLRTTAVVR